MSAGAAATLQPARPGEADALSELAFRSKAYWGYSEAFMAACRKELTYDPAALDRLQVVTARRNGVLVGFYALGPLAGETVELEALFVAPEAIGQGHGGRLLEHATQRARESGARRIVVHSDPNAKAFYLAAGARVVGASASQSIAGRLLPSLAIDLD